MMQPTTLEGYRLSPQQARLWSLQQADPEPPYQVQAQIDLAGPLKPVRLIAALRELINRHEILRTTFQWLPGMTEPLQVIGAPLSPESEPDWWSCHDLTALDASAQATALKRHWQELHQTPFAPQQVPIQAVLVRLSEHESRLLLKLAGLCADAATLPRIVQELGYIYGTSAEQTPGDEPIQYADLAEWQHELLESDETASGQNHWRQLALGEALAVRLPGRLRSHSTSQPFCLQTVSHRLPGALVRSLQAITQRVDASLQSFLLATWQVLLGRLTGQGELVVGTAFDGRHYDDLAGAIGLLTRYLPIHQVLSPVQSFAQVWAKVRTQLDSEAQWQDYFIWDLWRLQPEQSFFSFGFDYREVSTVQSTSNLTFALEQCWACTERYQVHLTCHHQDDALTCEFGYDASDLTADAIERLAEQYEVLLKDAVSDSDRPIGELKILSPAARHQILVEFNPTLPPPVEGCLHHRFEAQVRQTPDALAVVCDEQSLSYKQLNQRANQLAHFLQQQGVGVDTPVALYLERSCELIVSLLGIVKAGGAYLPIDPALPPAAIAQRLDHAQTPIILTQTALLDGLPATTAHVICLDRDWDAVAQYSSDNPHSAVRPDNLAYIIYTSGSTGQPKGVAVEHRHLLSYLNGIGQKLNLPSGASYASVSTVAADLGNTIIFSALCTGGCLHLISTERASNPDALAQYCQQHPIDCLKIVPSHLQSLLASAAEPAQLLPQRCLILGGEASHWSLIEIIQQYSDCRILNHYGPTETTVGVLAYAIEGFDGTDAIAGKDELGSVPLGRPLAHSQVYVLDEQQQPVPIGVAGELYIGGATIARGYWHQPELTAERFVANPFGAGRLYRTGDRVRYQADGTLEFLGRLDEQVKLRGYRIELGEIEAVLAQHPAVRQSVVLLREDSPTPKRLVAYVVLHHPIQTEKLQEFLAQRLPDYMVPGAVVTLDALPLTANGKLDRQALPTPETLAAQAAYTPPTTPAEKTLAQIWAEVLGLEQIGVEDNFFSLGGDSILSIQVIARANQAGLSLTPKQLFDHQTVKNLAAVAGTEKAAIAEQGMVTGAVPLTPIQQWFWQQAFAQPHHWNQAVLLDCRPSLDPEVLRQTVALLLKHHDGLRSRFVSTESGWQQEVLPLSEHLPVVEVIDLSGVPEAEQAAAMEAEANRLQGSLDLEAGDLVRVALFALGAEQPQRLLIVVHHLVIDGVSWRILLEDFQTVYDQLRLGQPVRLPAKTTAFQHWAKQLQAYAQSSELHQELTVWQSLLQSVSPSIPVDVTKGSNAIASTQTLTVELTAAETQALLQVVPQVEQAHINEVLLTALAQAFQPWADQPALLVDLEGHGREELFSDIDLSRTVGWFTTVYPVCLPLQTTTWSATLAAIKAQFQQIPHHGLGYGVLRYLTADSSIASLPQAQVKFNYLGQFDQVFAQSTLFQPSESSPGQTRSADNHRSHLIDVVGLVTDGKLSIAWTYSRHRHHESTIAALAQAFIAALRSRLSPSERAIADGDQPLEQWHQDLQLDAAIQAHPDLIQPLAQPQQVLLTGASGFLGAFLLHELLQQTSAQVHCLVRSADNQSAQQRLQQHLQQYQLWRDDYASRITPWAGDLSQPHLGLTADAFQVLAGQIDRIYHNGAAVNLAYPYQAVRAANVLGTQSLLRLATQVKLKPIAYVSTLSVFSGLGAESTTMAETTDLDRVPPPPGGYARSKWVAENLLWSASDRGVPVAIYRPGRILGHQQTGICNTRDRLSLMLRGCFYLGCAPAVQTIVDMTPVDYISRAIVHLSLQPTSWGQAFHLCNPQPVAWCDLVQQIQALGYPLQLVSYEQWQQTLAEQWRSHLQSLSNPATDHPLYPLMILFADAADGATASVAQSLAADDRQFDCQNTCAALRGSAITCPAIDPPLLQRYLTYFSRRGFFKLPEAVSP